MKPERREKMFGLGRPRALDRNVKVRIMHWARCLGRRNEKGRAYGTDKERPWPYARSSAPPATGPANFRCSRLSSLTSRIRLSATGQMARGNWRCSTGAWAEQQFHGATQSSLRASGGRRRRPAASGGTRSGYDRRRHSPARIRRPQSRLPAPRGPVPAGPGDQSELTPRIGARLVRGRNPCRTSDSASSRRPSISANSAVTARIGAS
jgi:hypothetical protein